MPSRHPLIPLALALFFLCVASVPRLAAAASDELVWRGDQATGRAIMDDLAKDYAKEKKGKIVLQPFSTLSGLDAVEAGTADIAGSARGKDARRTQEANLDFVPVALDAAVLITHPKNPVSNLTLKQVYDIYYGRITNWKDLGGPDRPINLYSIASPLDGVEFSLRQLIYRNGAQPVAAPRLYLNTAKLEEAITIDPAGLGLSTLASTYANTHVKRLSIEGVAASAQTVADASYPLYITLYLADRSDSPKHAAIERFIAYLDTPSAQAVLRRHQLIPYAAATEVVARNERRMAYIDTQVGRSAAEGAAATLAATTPTPTPVSAPRATSQSKVRIAPTAETTELARENLARAERKKAAEHAAAAAKKVATAKNAAPVHATTKATPHKEVAKAKAVKPAAPAHVKTRVAKAAPQKPHAAKTAPKKAAVSFDDVSAGASGEANPTASMRILAVSLDLDDTLWPVAPVLLAAEQQLDAWLRAHHAEVAAAWPIDALRTLRERIAAQRPDLAHDFTAQRMLTLQHAFTADDHDDERVRAAFEVYYAARNQVDCYADVRPALRAIAARMPLVSISNGNADLERIGLHHDFRHCICARELGCAKPAAAIFHAACARLGLAPENVLHVGDDPLLDIAGAHAAGLRTAWLNRAAAQWPARAAGADGQRAAAPDLEIRDLGELAHWIEQTFP